MLGPRPRVLDERRHDMADPLKCIGGSTLPEYVGWDAVNWSRALEYWRVNSSLLGGENILAIEAGAREGGLSQWALDIGLRVHCTDREMPLAAKRPVFHEDGVAERISFGAWDLVSGPCECTGDIVMAKSVLGALGNCSDLAPQRMAIENMYASLRPGGELWLAENLVGSPLHMFARRRFVPWGERWLYFKPGELRGLLQPFSKVEMGFVGFLGAFGRAEWQRRVLGRVDQGLYEKIMPTKWRYIGICVAKKA